MLDLSLNVPGQPLGHAMLAFVVSVLLVPPVTALAHRLGAVAHPRTDRLSRRTVPTLGGLPIAAAIAVGALFAPLATTDKAAFLAGMIAMAALGLVDDLGSISPRQRLLIEALVAAAFAATATASFDPPLRMAAIAVAAVAFPVAINATNLVDNADGLAASLGIVTALSLLAMNSLSGVNSTAGALCIVITAALVGFLLFNLPPARVFMGDVGSLMLGFSLAAASAFIVRDSLAIAGDAHKAVAILVPVAWALQVGDLAMVFATRLQRGTSPFRGGVDHTSHRLLAAGLGPRQMLATLALIGAGLGVVAAGAVALSGDFRLVAVVAVLLALLVALFEGAVARLLPFPGEAPPRSLVVERGNPEQPQEVAS